MSGNSKQFWKILVVMVVLGLASLACSGIFQAAQEYDCDLSGGQWVYDSYFNEYYCKNAGPEYTHKYFPTETPTASPVLETPPQNAQEMSPTETTSSTMEPSTTGSDASSIAGSWRGTAQWLCDTNPVWSTTLDFGSNGSVSASLSNTSDTASAVGTWDISGNEIRIQFERGLWAGTLGGNSISGTFVEENCSGVWSVTKD